ncbi:MAG TPA: hypothetical protein VH143_35850 [Kofleriaceae bacterium]|nr:hypothetical protein [Kofleriaceae bacterium]
MSTAADELLAECIAHPGDDAPRLVWADAIGGERGELVAIQCAPREQLSAAELASLNRRERELSRKSLALSGLAHLAHRVRFRRGFVDAADCDAEAVASRSDEIRRIAPLITSLTVRRNVDLRRVVTKPIFDQIRGLDLVDRRVAGTIRVLVDTGVLPRLTALGFGELDYVETAALVQAGIGSLERLWLRDSTPRGELFQAIGEAATSLRALDATSLLGGEARQFATGFTALTELVLRDAAPRALDGLRPLRDRLERLSIRTRTIALASADLAPLRELSKLRVLEIGTVDELELEQPPQLRELYVDGARSLVTPIAALDLLDLRRASRAIDGSACGGDVMVDEPVVHELLHVHPAMRGEWRVAPESSSLPPGREAWLAVISGPHTGRVIEIGEHDYVGFGIGMLRDIGADASITWHETAHILSTATGREARYAPRGTLADGELIELDDVRVRFFTGPNAGARAGAVAKAAVS